MDERGPWRDDWDARPQCAGKSLLDLMEERLDEVVWEIAVERASGVADPAHVAHLQGQAMGLATSIALVRTPYAPDVDAVRAAAGARYQQRLALAVPA